MEKIKNIDIPISPVCLGTWVFGEKNRWGDKNEFDPFAVLTHAIAGGVNIIDTAPAYGNGRSEQIVGEFLSKNKLRTKVVIATKLGITWNGEKAFPNLKKKRMFQELDESRKRLSSDYIDLYQVHKPDFDTPIEQVAEVMHSFYRRGIIRAVGVSNFSLSQINNFMKYCPLHCLQPKYSMFERGIENDIIPFSLKYKIAIIPYGILDCGFLTEKFICGDVPIAEKDIERIKKTNLENPFFSINKKTLINLKDIASQYNKTLAQLVINWTFTQKGIVSAIVGMRNMKHSQENLGSMGWSISAHDMERIDRILRCRIYKIKAITLWQRCLKKIVRQT